MCKVHWNQYTAGLARDAKTRKAANEEGDAPELEPKPETKPPRATRTVKATEHVAAVANEGTA